MDSINTKSRKYISNYLKSYKPYKGKWCYEDGCLLQGAMLLYKTTKEDEYLNFVYSYLDDFID
ncbi:MAG: glycoside hydrolase family 88 protein, partial [Cetobacterium sp.]